MSWSKRLQRWLRALAGGADSGRRIPEAIDYSPLPLPEAPEPRLSMATEPAAPKIAYRRNAVFTAFNTAVPVTDRHGLAGRQRELARLVDAVVNQHKHALIFGARGSGKTSLARVFGDLADEAGCVALYGSANADADIDALFRPFLAELPLRGNAATQAPLDVQQLGNLFVQSLSQRAVLIIDEFDRVASERTKQDVAALLKLLSDIQAPVQVVLVGIAANVDGLIAAHPSLRRHLYAQPTPPIERDDLAALLELCAKQAGIAFEEQATQTIASAAIGSPYHARLFGMHAALIAEAADHEVVTLADARRGLNDAVAEWSELTPGPHALFERALADAGSVRGVVALAGVLAAHSPALTFERLTAAAADLFGDQLSRPESIDRAIGLIGPALRDTPVTGEFQFEDSLAPQFLVLMANGTGRMTATPAHTSDSNRARELLQGVAGL